MVRLSHLADDITSKLFDAMDGLGKDGVRIMQDSVAVASGWLRNSINHKVEMNAKGVTLTYEFPLKYTEYVEYGTPPHFPPISAIKEWCVDVGVPVEAAYPIAVKISKVGTRPQPFIRPFVNDKLPRVLEKNLQMEFRTP
jgi:hypothetical protein